MTFENTRYYVPPGYHAMFGTRVKDDVMDSIQTLRLRLELQRAASLNMHSDIIDRAKYYISVLIISLHLFFFSGT